MAYFSAPAVLLGLETCRTATSRHACRATVPAVVVRAPRHRAAGRQLCAVRQERAALLQQRHVGPGRHAFPAHPAGNGQAGPHRRNGKVCGWLSFVWSTSMPYLNSCTYYDQR